MANRVATATARPGTGRSGGTHGCVPKPKCTASTFALLCERRTVNPPIARTRYNFLRSFFRAGLPEPTPRYSAWTLSSPRRPSRSQPSQGLGVDHDGLIHQVLDAGVHPCCSVVMRRGWNGRPKDDGVSAVIVRPNIDRHDGALARLGEPRSASGQAKIVSADRHGLRQLCRRMQFRVGEHENRLAWAQAAEERPSRSSRSDHGAVNQRDTPRPYPRGLEVLESAGGHQLLACGVGPHQHGELLEQLPGGRLC